MIYTVISDLSQLNNICNNENRDCRYERQPLSLISKETREYIDSTKNEELRNERLLAYTSLFSSLKYFYGIDNCYIERTSEGKPFLVLNNEANDFLDSEEKCLVTNGNITTLEEKQCKKTALKKTKNDESITLKKLNNNINISLSHSDGVVAVCISDEGEVGVDIQADVEKEKKAKLEQRFFKNISFKSENIGVKYFFLSFNNSFPKFEEIEPENCSENDFISRWSYCESVLKLDGKGFKNIEKIEKKSKKTRSEGKKIEKNRKKYVFFTTKQK